jgi:hypothetical protein
MTASNGQDNDYADLKGTVEELRRYNEELKNRMTGYEQETIYDDEEEEEDILEFQPLAEYSGKPQFRKTSKYKLTVFRRQVGSFGTPDGGWDPNGSDRSRGTPKVQTAIRNIQRCCPTMVQESS